MKKSFNITFSALFTALICVLAQISFVTPAVPITLQIFGVALCGFTLNPKWSFGCIVTYIVVGGLGLPVFSAFQGGIQVILGPTGGFILGFILLTLGCSLSTLQIGRVPKILFVFSGLTLCYTVGALQYSLVTGNSLTASLITACLPFILKDTALIVSAYFLSEFIKKRISGLKA